MTKLPIMPNNGSYLEVQDVKTPARVEPFKKHFVDGLDGGSRLKRGIAHERSVRRLTKRKDVASLNWNSHDGYPGIGNGCGIGRKAFGRP
jgi:hypothetical protein